MYDYAYAVNVSMKSDLGAFEYEWFESRWLRPSSNRLPVRSLDDLYAAYWRLV